MSTFFLYPHNDYTIQHTIILNLHVYVKAVIVIMKDTLELSCCIHET